MTSLILDPFDAAAAHGRMDGNATAEVAPLLAYLRDLQRHYQLAVVVVHHARKGAARLRQLYLRRHHDQLTLSVERRAAPSRTGDQGRRTARARRAPAGARSAGSHGMHGGGKTQQGSRSACARTPTPSRPTTALVLLAGLRLACQMRTATLCARSRRPTEKGRSGGNLNARGPVSRRTGFAWVTAVTPYRNGRRAGWPASLRLLSTLVRNYGDVS
ncbi:MAG: AAA family ATPase, partial [Chloroflexi bacterium]|nr:AAA family ATPase [Chloroflexota bacterium]